MGRVYRGGKWWLMDMAAKQNRYSMIDDEIIQGRF
jgi:hypothetical protein